MKKLLIALGILVPGLALAHLGPEDPVQHGMEHLLLAALLVPVLWLIVRKLIKSKDR